MLSPEAPKESVLDALRTDIAQFVDIASSMEHATGKKGKYHYSHVCWTMAPPKWELRHVPGWVCYAYFWEPSADVLSRVAHRINKIAAKNSFKAEVQAFFQDHHDIWVDVRLEFRLFDA